jgi:hypothetical protein
LELPTITKSAYASSAVDHMALGVGAALFQHAQNPQNQFVAQLINPQQQAAQAQGKAEMSNARIVKVFIADPNDNLPLEKRVLYKGDEMLTDLTDQELFYEVPIAELLAKHNEYRKTVVDKKQAEKFGRDIFMEAARIRDLRMVVVDVAKF